MDTLQTSTRTYSFADDEDISLTLTNHSGDVVVLLDADPGTAEVVLRARRPVDFAPVTTSCHRGAVRVEVPPLLDPDGGRGFSFSLGPISIGIGAEQVTVEAHVPAGADVSVSTKQGDVVLQGLAGDVQLRSGSGDLRTDETARLRAATGSGDVVVGRCSGGSVTSGSGDITLGTATGEVSLEVRSGSGGVRIGTNGGDATVATGSGDITVGHDAGSLSARAGTGDVSLTVPRGIPVWLDLSSGTGDVRRDIESHGAPAEGQPHLRLTARTGTGDIAVRH